MATNDTNPTPAEQEQKEFITAAAANLWGSMNLTQLKQLLAAHKTGDLEQDFISIIGEIAQKAQEHPAGHEVQEDIAKMPGYRPELDPESPEFNIEAYKTAVEQAGGFSALEAGIMEKFVEATQPTADAAANALTGEPLRQTLEAIGGNPARPTLFDLIGERVTQAAAPVIGAAQEALQAAMTGITAFINSDTYKSLVTNLQAIAAYIEEHKEEFEAAGDKDLAPFLKMELEAAKTNPEFANVTLADIFLQGIDADGNPTDSKFKGLIERAKQRRAEAEAAEEQITEIEKAAEELQTIRGMTPQSHVMPNNALMNDLTTKSAINAGSYDMVVRNANKRHKEITAYTTLTLEPGNNGVTIEGTNLSEYERQVSDAVVSLYIEAELQQLPPLFTVDMIYRAMPGGGDKASPQQREAINATMGKFRHLNIYVDATEEATRRGIDLKGGSYIFDENYLQIRRHTFKSKNGDTVTEAYEIKSTPVILTYCRLTKQLLTTPAENLIIRGVTKRGIAPVALTMTADRQALTGYMLRRILVMKRSREDAKEQKRKYDAKRRKAAQSGDMLPEKSLDDFIIQKPVILFATMFAETGTETDNRLQTKRNRDFCFSCMDYWKARGLIKGYNKRNTGRAITALEIEL